MKGSDILNYTIKLRPRIVMAISYTVMIIGGMMLTWSINGFVFMNEQLADENSIKNIESYIVQYNDSTSFILQHYKAVYSVFLLIAIFYIIGGFFLLRSKNWASKLVSLITFILLAILWYSTFQFKTVEYSNMDAMLYLLIMSIPFVLVVFLLNWNRTKIYF